MRRQRFTQSSPSVRATGNLASEATIAAAGETGFDAFISYSHAHATLARRIQSFLETYRWPEEAGAGETLRVYLDETDTRSGELSGELEAALDVSRALIILCSSDLPNSRWVQEEIAHFLPTKRPIVPILIDGDPETSIPEILGDRFKYVDLRGGWVLGWLRAFARDELTRLVALLADLDLRVLVPWDERRRRTRRLKLTAASVALATSVAIYPTWDWGKLPLGISTSAQLEFCEVVDGQLLIANRSHRAGRNVVEVFRGPGSEKLKLNGHLGNDSYLPNNRVLPMGHETASLFNRTGPAGQIESGGRVPTPQWFTAFPDGSALTVHRFKDEDYRAAPEDPPYAGEARVVFFDAGAPEGAAAEEKIRSRIVDDLCPESRDPDLPKPSAVPFGLPVARRGSEVWLGAPAWISEGIPGGLWRNSGGGDWERIYPADRRASGGFLSVNSIAIDPEKPERVYVTEIAREGIRLSGGETSVTSKIFVRDGAEEDWAEFDGPDHALDATIELCGFLPDRGLIVRVNNDFFAEEYVPLYRRLGWN